MTHPPPLFSLQGKTISTPGLGGTILPGITRRSVCELAMANGYEVQERRVTVEELLAADEVCVRGRLRPPFVLLPASCSSSSRRISMRATWLSFACRLAGKARVHPAGAQKSVRVRLLAAASKGPGRLGASPAATD